MEEIGVVREINGPKAIVAVQKQSACESCPGGKLCSTIGAEGRMEAINNAHAGVGDTVRVVLKPYTYLKGTMLVYGIPALMLIVGAVIGKEFLSKIFVPMDPDLASAVGGFGLFALSFLFIRLFTRRYEAKKEYMPVIEEIMSKAG